MSITDNTHKLVSLLNRRPRGVTLTEMTRELRCSSATVHRARREAETRFNVEIIYDREREVYHLESGSRIELPGLYLEPAELAALLGLTEWMESSGAAVFKEKLEPLRAQLESALRDKGIPVREWRERVRLLPMHFRRVDPDVLVCVADAVLRRHRIALEYKGSKDTEYRERRVSPQRFVQYRHNWYLDAYDHGARALRCFALSRVRSVRVISGDVNEIPYDQLDTHFAASYGIFGGRAKAKAVLVFEGEAARIVRDEVWHPKQRVLDLPDGRFRLEFPCGDVRELARDVMRFADEVTVEEPAALREAVAGMVRRAAGRLAELKL